MNHPVRRPVPPPGPGPAVRRQWSLYVPPPWAAPIEAVRRLLDPLQHRLIPAHVTLCRDDEPGLDLPPRPLPDKASNLMSGAADDPAGSAAAPPPLRLSFGAPQRFGGHGVLLPLLAGAEAFQAWRRHLAGPSAGPGHIAHLTLAHPRNPPPDAAALRSALGPGIGSAPGLAGQWPVPLEIEFTAVQVIEQTDAGPWRVLSTHALQAGRGPLSRPPSTLERSSTHHER